MAVAIARIWSGMLVAFMILGLSPVIAQDPATTGATADTSPEELLRAKDLKLRSFVWILDDAETKVLKDLRDARTLYHRLEDATMRRHRLELGFQERQGALIQLRAESAEVSQQIAQLDQQLENLVAPPSGNNFVAQQRDVVANQRNGLVRQNNQLINQINTLQEMSRTQTQGDDPRLQLNAEIAESREKFMQALVDMRASVDQVKAQYDVLSKDTEVTKALVALSQGSKNKHRLGPSKALNDAIKLLEKSEGTVKSEEIRLIRESGVFHVYATLGKTPIKMVFDTGAGPTTISAKLAAKVGVKPRPVDSDIQLKTADGTVVAGKLGVIPTVRVGKFTIANVECAIMPEDKGEIDPLLGQTFFKNFSKVEFNPDAGKLTLKQIETETKATAAASEPAKSASRATAKTRRPSRQLRPSAKSKQQ